MGIHISLLDSHNPFEKWYCEGRQYTSSPLYNIIVFYYSVRIRKAKIRYYNITTIFHSRFDGHLLWVITTILKGSLKTGDKSRTQTTVKTTRTRTIGPIALTVTCVVKPKSAHRLVSWFLSHDDVIQWKHIPRYWPFVWGIHRCPVNSPHKGLWRGVLIYSLICARINGWVNNREDGDLRRHRAHYDVIVIM